MRNNRSIAVIVSKLYSVERLRNRTDLIQLYKYSISSAKVNTLLQSLDICNEEIVTNELNLITKLLSDLCPAFPVLLIERILDRDDRVLVYELCPVLY